MPQIVSATVHLFPVTIQRSFLVFERMRPDIEDFFEVSRPGKIVGCHASSSSTYGWDGDVCGAQGAEPNRSFEVASKLICRMKRLVVAGANKLSRMAASGSFCGGSKWIDLLATT